MKDKILITGGLGYIGGRISKYLNENTDFVLRLSTRRKELKLPKCLEKCEIVQMDLESDEDIYSACIDVQYIIHLAGMNEIYCKKDPESALIVNTLGTLKLLNVAEKLNIKKFIYFSTAHVYGANLQGKVNEQSLTRPMHPYAITHKAAEEFVLSATKGIVLRLSNSFGPPLLPDVDRWSLLVNDLCKQAVIQKKLVLKSSGVQQRDFITLKDVCRAVLHFIFLDECDCADGLFNVGGELTLSIGQMAELIKKQCVETLKFNPIIIKPPKKKEKIGVNLDYKIDKIKSTGFELQGNPISEINSMLHFCKNEFSD